MLDLCNVDEQGTLSLVQAETGGWYLLSSCGVEDKVGNHDSEHRKSRISSLRLSQAQKVLHFTFVPVLTNLCSISRLNNTLAKKLDLEETMVPPDSVFIGYRYLQNSGAEWCGKHYLCYRLYLFPKDVQLLDAIAFVHRIGLSSKGDNEENSVTDVE